MVVVKFLAAKIPCLRIYSKRRQARYFRLSGLTRPLRD
nr:MAG TPA: hypothetical protein [Inoviridae sp.]